MLSKLALSAVALVLALTAAQGPGSYYDNIDKNATGAALQQELTALISKHKMLTYADLWTAFQTTDEGLDRVDGCPANLIDDIYSDTCWTAVTEQCGNYKKEGDCYNREHSWPKSWWNGSASVPAYTDLNHMRPTDGYDNNRRANFPFGYVDPNVAPAWTTSNGCKLGPCVAAPGSSQPVPATSCWEESDELKGEMARVYLYMETSYADIFTCCDTDGTVGAKMKPWLLETMLDWHARFPVSAAEAGRNDRVFQVQGNRNPFIDFPQWVDKIWGPAPGGAGGGGGGGGR